MTEQRSTARTLPLGFEQRSQTRPLGHEQQGEIFQSFKSYLAQEGLCLLSASQLTGVRTSTLWRLLQELPVSGESALQIRNGLQAAGRPYMGPIAIKEVEPTGHLVISTPSTRIHKVMIDSIATIYEGQDQNEAMQSFLSAIETFTDQIQYTVEKVPVK